MCADAKVKHVKHIVRSYSLSYEKQTYVPNRLVMLFL